MDLTTMRTQVRRDLHDEDAAAYRWTSDELDRHIAHALKDLSEAIPLQVKATKATTSGSREIDISTLTGLVHVEAVEYPVDKFPRVYQRYSFWNNIITLLGEDVPDGSNAYIYYGKLHTLAATSTIPERNEDLLALGAEGYALVEWGAFAINRANVSGGAAPRDFVYQGTARLKEFKKELKRLGRRARVLANQLYAPANAVRSQSTDWGP